jgi:hypothetical protein
MYEGMSMTALFGIFFLLAFVGFLGGMIFLEGRGRRDR